MKFKVIAGTHQEADGKVYRAGTKNDTVETDLNYLEKFPNKFELIGDPAQLKNAKQEEGPSDAAAVREGSGGLIANVSRSQFPEVKEEGPTEAKAPKGKGTKAKRAAAEEDDEGVEEAGENDVTSQFPAAVEADLVVTKTEDGRYNIAKADAPDEPLNEAPLTKAGVGKHLKAEAAPKKKAAKAKS
jgi:hypothetical protein